ncbi:MAG: hypothetical protein AB1505_00740 [Candidatus Latescibacterota bacterium]
MALVRVLVSSPSPEIGAYLREMLPAAGWEVIATQPGPAFVEAAQHERPEVAVLDCIHERPQTAQLEIAVLKSMRPGVRIIALSGRSSPQDVPVVAQGVFYYLAQEDWRAVLAAVVQAAGQSRQLPRVGCTPQREGGKR